MLQLTKDNFEAEVLKSSTPVLVDFWAPWCGPCRMMGPVLEEAAAEAPEIKTGKVNVDEESGLAEQYNIMSIPALLLFKDGSVARREAGAMPKDELVALMKS